MCKITDKLNKEIDIHAMLHHAEIINEAQRARDEIFRKVNFHIRSIAQSRRWREFRKFNGGGK